MNFDNIFFLLLYELLLEEVDILSTVLTTDSPKLLGSKRRNSLSPPSRTPFYPKLGDKIENYCHFCCQGKKWFKSLLFEGICMAWKNVGLLQMGRVIIRASRLNRRLMVTNVVLKNQIKIRNEEKRFSKILTKIMVSVG